MIEPLLLTTVRIQTFSQNQLLSTASGFFFERDQRLFLVTSRHVLYDEPSQHFPDHLLIELHVDAKDMAQAVDFFVPLYHQTLSLWRQGQDGAGAVDIAVVELQRTALPQTLIYRAFTPSHLLDQLDPVEVGTSLLVVGFPLGFHDTLHHTPVVRQAVIASSFGLRFQGQGYFLTDARTHRGTSGAPVVMRRPRDGSDDLPWLLLGIHSARLDVGSRNVQEDEALGLNCAWYADILMTLTGD